MIGVLRAGNRMLSGLLGQGPATLTERVMVEVGPDEEEPQDGRSFPCHPRVGGVAKELQQGVLVATERTRIELPFDGLEGYEIKRGDQLVAAGRTWQIFAARRGLAGWLLEATEIPAEGAP